MSRSAASPALPTAITMRPQLASSPAIAVFTSGELAIESAMRLAASSVSAPVTSMRISFCAPSPSFTTCSARSSSTASSFWRNSVSRLSVALVIGGVVRALAGGEQQQRVAGGGVAVHRDGIERGLHARGQQLLQAPGRADSRR